MKRGKRGYGLRHPAEWFGLLVPFHGMVVLVSERGAVVPRTLGISVSCLPDAGPGRLLKTRLYGKCSTLWIGLLGDFMKIDRKPYAPMYSASSRWSRIQRLRLWGRWSILRLLRTHHGSWSQTVLGTAIRDNTTPQARLANTAERLRIDRDVSWWGIIDDLGSCGWLIEGRSSKTGISGNFDSRGGDHRQLTENQTLRALRGIIPDCSWSIHNPEAARLNFASW